MRSLCLRHFENDGGRLVGRRPPRQRARSNAALTRNYQKVHRQAIKASKAYGETITTYVEYRRFFLSDDFMTDRYYRKQRDGLEWDSLAHHYSRSLLLELERIRAREPQGFRLLIPSETLLEGIEGIGPEEPVGPAVSPFN